MRAEAGSWFVRGAGLALGAGFVVLLGLLAVRSIDVVLLVFLAVLLGAALEPVVAAIRARTGLGRGAGILVVYAGFLAAVIVFALFVVPGAVVQISTAISRLPSFLETLRTSTYGLRPHALADGLTALIDALEASIKPAPPPSTTDVVTASLNAVEALGGVVTLLVLVFFWLTGRARLQWYVLSFLPSERRAGTRDAWNDVELRLGQWARGQLTLMLAIGVGTGVAYTLIGLPAALLLALIAALAEVVPIIGPLIGAIPALLMATTVSPETAVLTLGVYVLLQFLEGNVLVPMIMRDSVGLSPFLVLISILVGWSAAGPAGAIIAVPLVAGIEVVLGRLQDRETPVAIDAGAEPTPGEGSSDPVASSSS
jgi:predicted PurR-regulated permease PerM